MRKKGHLRLVKSEVQLTPVQSLRGEIIDCFEKIFVSKNEKIYVLRDIILRMYRDYEITTGICDIGFYEKTENKINQIISENKTDYYYKLLKKYRR